LATLKVVSRAWPLRKVVKYRNMLERARKLFERIQRENEERQIQSSVTYNLRRTEEFNNKAGISLKLGVSVDDKELFESLLAVSIMEKETKITDRVQDPITEMVTESLNDFNAVLGRNDSDKIAFQRIQNSSKKSLDDLPEGHIFKRKNMSAVINLLSSIYIDCMKNKTDFKESFEKRKEYIKKLLVE